MDRKHLETDYLVIGSGAVGMAFVDVLLSETTASIIIVDRYPKPGGHWNWAYPFVTLHQPSTYYGVPSKELSKGKLDNVGLNKGLLNLATGDEIMAYYNEVMQHTFLSSGRVLYFPSCEYIGEQKFHSKLSGKKHCVKVHKKTIDCTYLNTSVPATHVPNFTIEKDVQFISINEIPFISKKPKKFVIIGGGKTGIDACLWLLERGVNQNDITWIVSRDAWLLDRKNTQNIPSFFKDSIGAQANQFKAIAESTSIDDLFHKLEKVGVLSRIDTEIKPTMFHGATISKLELDELRKIKNIIRKGRVKSIGTNKIVLSKGSIPTSIEHVHIDCSASAINNLIEKPIFQNMLITPQTVRSYQPVFSASLIAFVEANYSNENTKNKMCKVVPIPNHDTDWIPVLAINMHNQYVWKKTPIIRKWLYYNRLDGFSKMVADVNREDIQKIKILKEIKKYLKPAMIKLEKYIQEI